MRRILYQLGSIQNMSALPGDPTFYRAISASHTAKTGALETFTSMHKVPRKQNMNILGGINSVMRVEKRLKEI